MDLKKYKPVEEETWVVNTLESLLREVIVASNKGPILNADHVPWLKGAALLLDSYPLLPGQEPPSLAEINALVKLLEEGFVFELPFQGHP